MNVVIPQYKLYQFLFIVPQNSSAHMFPLLYYCTVCVCVFPLSLAVWYTVHTLERFHSFTASYVKLTHGKLLNHSRPSMYRRTATLTNALYRNDTLPTARCGIALAKHILSYWFFYDTVTNVYRRVPWEVSSINERSFQTATTLIAAPSSVRRL